MNKLVKILVLLGAIAPLAAFGVSPDQPPSTNATDKLQALFSDSVVVKGKGLEIKRSELDTEVVNARAALAARRYPVPPDLDRQALTGLVIKRLILSKATDADRTEGKNDFESRVAKMKANSGLSDEEFEKRLSAQLYGKTRAQWEKENAEQFTFLITRAREMGVNVTDDDAKKYYDDPANISKFEEPEMVRVSHILLMTSDPQTQQPLSDEKKAAKHKQMEDLLKRARSGEDFTKLADQYSEDPGVKDNHGEYQFSRADRYVEEFKAAAFALTNVNDVSDIVTTQYGYHILKLNKKIPAKKVDFDKYEVKDYLRQVALEKKAEAYRTYLAKAEKDASLEILDDSLKGTDLLPPEPQSATNNMAAPQAQK
jgi:parvulin-like peptidyl-prolyl isomerase